MVRLPGVRDSLQSIQREHVIHRLRSCENKIRAEGVEHLSIFGSRARGQHDPESDLDVLVEITPGHRFSLLNLSGVALLVEDATGLASQIVLKRSAPAHFVERISGDLVSVF